MSILGYVGLTFVFGMSFILIQKISDKHNNVCKFDYVSKKNKE